MPNKLLDAIYKRYGELGDDFTFMEAASFHTTQLTKVFKNDEDFNVEEYDKSLLSKMFVDNMHTHPRNEPVTALEYDSPPHLMPFETFVTLTPGIKQTRQEQMFKLLQKGDVLSLEVVSSTDKSYELKILEKVGCHRKMNDLDFMATLPKTNETEKLLENELQKSEFIQAAIIDLLNEFNVVVTLDKSVIGVNSKNIKLGRIDESSLPIRLTFKEKFTCVANYASSQPLFWNPNTFSDAAKRMNIDLSHIYSYDESWNMKRYPSESYAKQLAETTINDQANQHFQDGILFYQSKEITAALDSFDRSIKLVPNNAKVYEARAQLYLDIGSEGINSKAVIDWHKALTINEESIAKVNLSATLAYKALSFFWEKNFSKALVAVLASLKLNPRNAHARKTLRVLHKKINKSQTPESAQPSTSSGCSRQSSGKRARKSSSHSTKGFKKLDVLQIKKKELEAELERYLEDSFKKKK